MNAFKNYLQLIRFDKPIGSYLLLWPTLTALVIASHGAPSAKNVLIFTLGVFLMRSAGCIVNDFLDRNFDQYVTRTISRPLAAGKVSVFGAMIFCAILLLLAFLLVLQTNMETIALAFVAVILTTLYPLMKRITHLPQVWLGLTFNWGIVMAYSASEHSLDLTCWLLYLATVLLTVAYDTFYAMVDREDDLKIGLKSTAILFGQNDRLMCALLQLAYFALILCIALILKFNLLFYIGYILSIVCALYQQWLVRHRNTNACFKAFLNNHYLLLFIFLGVVMTSL